MLTDGMGNGNGMEVSDDDDVLPIFAAFVVFVVVIAGPDVDVDPG